LNKALKQGILIQAQMNFYSIEEVFRCISIKAEINLTCSAFVILVTEDEIQVYTDLALSKTILTFICSVLAKS